MSERQAKRQRKEQHERRIEIVALMAWSASPYDEEHALELAQALWQKTDEELKSALHELLLQSSPLRRMTPIDTHVDWSALMRLPGVGR